MNQSSSKRLAGLPEVLTVKQLAAVLMVHRSTVYRRIESGRIPARRFKRCIRMSREAVLRALA